ncbi:MAG: hypothetical protein WCQ64_15165, partial [Acidobacteriota bacterium]
EKIGKISVYVQSSVKARDAKSQSNFIRFAHLNLDAALAAALESLVWRPRLDAGIRVNGWHQTRGVQGARAQTRRGEVLRD